MTTIQKTKAIEAGVRRFLAAHPQLVSAYADTNEYRASIGDAMDVDNWLPGWYWQVDNNEAEHYGCIWTLIGNVTRELYEAATL